VHAEACKDASTRNHVELSDLSLAAKPSIITCPPPHEGSEPQRCNNSIGHQELPQSVEYK